VRSGRESGLVIGGESLEDILDGVRIAEEPCDIPVGDPKLREARDRAQQKHENGHHASEMVDPARTVI
jgi:hypothetical protein